MTNHERFSEAVVAVGGGVVAGVVVFGSERVERIAADAHVHERCLYADKVDDERRLEQRRVHFHACCHFVTAVAAAAIADRHVE